MNEDIFIGMAKAMIGEGKHQDALTILTSALQQYPNSAKLYFERGSVYMQIGNHEAALFDLKKASVINPEYLAAIEGKLKL